MASASPEPAADLLTRAEAAKLLKVSPVTISRWLKQGRLPAYRLGPRAVRIRRADLEGLLRAAFEPGEWPPADSAEMLPDPPLPAHA